MTWVPTPLMSGEEIYQNFQNGMGAEGLSSSAAMVNQLAGRHQERAEQIARVRSRLETAWQGPAAGAANRGLGPLVSEHDLSGHALHTAQDLTGRQAGSFGDARNAVMPVPPSPGEVDPLVVLTNPGVAATHYQQVAQHNQAAQHNVDVMNGYTGASQYNTDGQPASYGGLVNDQASIVVGSPETIDSEDYRESEGGAGPRGSAPGPGAGGDPGHREPAGGDGSGSRPESSVGPETWAGTTRPDSYTVPPQPAGSATLSPGADSGVGQSRPAPGGGLVPGVGVGIPVDGRGSTGGPRGGVVGGSPRGVGGGPGAGAGQPGAAGRAGPGMAAATGPGRGGTGFGGVPVGGRGRGEEDTERKAPDFLEGGDPEELFDTDQQTAPSAIGDEDD